MWNHIAYIVVNYKGMEINMLQVARKAEVNIENSIDRNLLSCQRVHLHQRIQEQCRSFFCLP